MRFFVPRLFSTISGDSGGTHNRQKSTTDGAARTEPSSLELCRVVTEDGAARTEPSSLELCRVVTEENEVKYDCRQKKKIQTSAKSIFQFFARLHFLTQIFAHSCIKV